MLSARSRLKELTAPEDAEDGLLYADSPGDIAAIEKARKERRRRKIIKELFETEKAYLHHLELIHKYFYFPLRFNCILPEDVHAILFSNIEQIKEVNRTLLDTMEQSTIGQAFQQLGPFLKLYSMYAYNHEQALSALQEWMQKSPEFAQFIRTEEARPEVMGLKINALLITPVQRIPRYKLLLEDLLQHTPIDHHDYQQLKAATKQIGEIATHINEHVRQHENFQKMLAIQKCFDSSAPKILQPGRVFLKEGPLKKVSRKGGKSLERMFFLFNDVLLYGKPKLLESGGRSYTCCCVLPIKHCKLERVFVTSTKDTDSDCAGGVFKITCKEESLLLFSDTVGVAEAWIETVERAIRKANDDRQTLRKPSSHKIPLRGRSLRNHRKQQKKAAVGMTPVRRKSVRKREIKTGDCCSPQMVEMRKRIEPFRERIQSWYDNLPTACASPPKVNKTVQPSLPPEASARLSVISDISVVTDEAPSFPGETESVRLSVVSDESEAGEEGASVSGASQRSSALVEDGENDSSFAVHDDMHSTVGDSPHTASGNISQGSLITTASGVEVYYPKGSQLNISTKSRTSMRTKIKSYLRRPFTRLQRVRQDLTHHCSPLTQRCSTAASSFSVKRR